MNRFRLKFSPSQIPELADRYTYQDDNQIETEIGPTAKRRGYFTKSEFATICEWKTPRIRSRIYKNPERLIIEATKIALSSPFEVMRMGTLQLLHGVGFPVASTILHFAHPEPYPIIDFRALWSLGIIKRPTFYTHNYWTAYTSFCRNLAEQSNVSMRILDRALWQYSKENQPQDQQEDS